MVNMLSPKLSAMRPKPSAMRPKPSAMRPLIECYCASAGDTSSEHDNLSSFSLQTQFNLACENDWIVGPEGCVLPIQLTKCKKLCMNFLCCLTLKSLVLMKTAEWDDKKVPPSETVCLSVHSL